MNYIINKPSFETETETVVIDLRINTAATLKVYILEEKFDNQKRKTQLSNALKILRMEIPSQPRSYFVLEKLLRDHNIDMKSYNLSYFDDEDDLISLRNEKDFRYMTKLMKGKLTKIVCEKRNHPRQPFSLQYTMPPFKVVNSNNKKERALQELNYASPFFPVASEVISTAQLSHHGKNSSCPESGIENSFLFIPGFKKQVDEKNEQSMEASKKDLQSFREYLLQRMKERYPLNTKVEDTTTEETKDYEKPAAAAAEEETERTREEIVQVVEKQCEDSPNMPPSLLLSNNFELNQAKRM